MELYIENIGKIARASIEIKGISVIAGENDVGKSTVGKSLFSVFNSFYEVEEQIRKERILSIVNALMARNYYFSYRQLEEFAEEILRKSEEYKTDLRHLEADLASFLTQPDIIKQTFDWDNIAKRVWDVLNVQDNDIFQSVINKKLDAEFDGQILNFDSADCGKISLKIKEEEIVLKISENMIRTENINHSLYTEAIYIDDPFILDDVYLGSKRIKNYFNHRMQLGNKISSMERNVSVVEEIVVENKFQKIYEKMASVCAGSIVPQKDRTLGYRLKNSDKTLSVKNMSTGLKTFAILKTLLANGTLTAGGTIILDEPEIHLHPEWQLLFAELIVLLQKEFNMHILLNTHSPYFLRAIQVYSVKYGIHDGCKYYLAEIEEDQKAYIYDVTDDIDKIYVKLSRPLQQLEDERWNRD